MPALFFVLLLLPLAELWVILRASDAIGLGPTLLVLVAVSVAGAWLLKREGVATWRRLQATMRRGQMPAQEAIDGALILFGGALLLTPGFITDAAGLLLILPVTRAPFKASARRLIGWFAFRRFGMRSVIGRQVWDPTASRRRRPGDAPSRTTAPAPPLSPPARDPGAEDGSPGRG